MDARAIPAALLLSFLLFSAASAFNITNLLSQFPDFNDLNNFLTQTNLAGEINSRKTITILALDNGAVSGLSGKPLDVQRRILSVHVILDYYDAQKLARLSSDNTTVLTTLFQASGAARNQQGFIKVGQISHGEIAFGSAVRGSQFDSRLVKSVVAQPYNICVLQISSPIQVPGIDVKPPRSSPSSPPPSSFSPVGSPKKAPAPSAKTPSKARAPPAKKPKVVADSPARSPPKSADGEDDAAAPAPSEKSGASRGSFIGAAAVMAVISVFLAL